MKRVVAACLPLLLMVTGCAAGERPAPPPTPTPTAMVDSGIERPMDYTDPAEWATTRATLYFFDENETMLVPKTTRIPKDARNTQAESVVDALLTTQPDIGMSPIVNNLVAFLGLEWSNDVAIVNLSRDWIRNYRDDDLYNTRLAIAKTLIGVQGIQYVQVLCGGRDPGIEGILPVGLLRPEGEVYLQENYDLRRSELARIEADPEDPEVQPFASIKREAAIYTPSRHGKFVLTTPVTVRVGADWVTPVIEAMTKTRAGASGLRAIFPDDIVITPEVLEMEDGRRVVDLRLSGDIDLFWENQDIDYNMAVGAVVLTLCTFGPKVDGVRLTLDDRLVTSVKDLRRDKRTELPLDEQDDKDEPDGFTLNGSKLDGVWLRSDFEDNIGQSISLYYPRAGEATQVRITRTVYQRAASQPEIWLRELLKERQASDPEFVNPFPEGAQESDVQEVTLSGDLAIVDLSGRFRTLCREQMGSSETAFAQESAMIYCMVNTITGFSGVKRVQFTVDGQIELSLAGQVYIEEPLLRHPGIIQPES